MIFLYYFCILWCEVYKLVLLLFFSVGAELFTGFSLACGFAGGTPRAAGAITAAFTFVFYGVPNRIKHQYQDNRKNTVIEKVHMYSFLS